MTKILLLSIATLLFFPAFSQRTKSQRKAERSYRKGEYDLAKQQLLAIYHSGNEHDYDVLYFLGATYINLEDNDSAQIFIDKCLIMPESKSHAAIYSNKALCQWLTNQDQEAIATLSKAIEIEPDEAEYYFYQGLIYYYADDFKNSCAAFAIALRMGDKHFPKNAFDMGCNSWPDEKAVEIIHNFPYWFGKKKAMIK